MPAQTQITMEQIIAAIKAAESQAPETVGFTTLELAEHLGVSPEIARKKLKNMLQAGVAKSIGRHYRTNIAGERSCIPCYALTGE